MRFHLREFYRKPYNCPGKVNDLDKKDYNQ